MAGGGDRSPWGAPRSDGSGAVRHLDMARAFLAASNFDAARREAEQAMSADPDDTTLYLALDVLADVCWERDNWPAVIDIGERMLEIDPNSSLGFIQLGRGLLKAKDWRRCDEVLNAGITNNPLSAGLMQLMSERWRLANGLATAEQWVRNALALAPDNTYLMGQLVLVMVDGGRHDDARAVIERMRELDPAGSRPLMLAAYASYHAARFRDAAVFAALALERDGSDSDALMFLRRARMLSHPLLAPYCWMQRQPPAIKALVLLAPLAMIVASPRFGAMAVMAIAAYTMACRLAVGLIESGHAARPPRQDVELKNY